MEATGKDVIERICSRLTYKDIRCYDSSIVQELRELNSDQLLQLVTLGNAVGWDNDCQDHIKGKEA